LCGLPDAGVAVLGTFGLRRGAFGCRPGAAGVPVGASSGGGRGKAPLSGDGETSSSGGRALAPQSGGGRSLQAAAGQYPRGRLMSSAVAAASRPSMSFGLGAGSGLSASTTEVASFSALPPPTFGLGSSSAGAGFSFGTGAGPRGVQGGASSSSQALQGRPPPQPSPPQPAPVDGRQGPVVGAKEKKKKMVCWRCKSKEHVTKDRPNDVYCPVCDKHDHYEVRCPILKMPRPTPRLCGYGGDKMGFFRIPEEAMASNGVATGIPPTVLVSVSGGTISAEVLQAELHRMIPARSSWTSEASPHGNNAFVVAFPSQEEVQRVANLQIRLKGQMVSLEFSEWNPDEVPPAFHLHTIWVNVKGVPPSLKHFLGMWAVGSVIGVTEAVDMLCFRKRGIIRILVTVLDPTLFPVEVDVAVAKV
ncbi:hypothetical protein BRADI_1g33171v3, partial [Brachypodium distachyon]